MVSTLPASSQMAECMTEEEGWWQAVLSRDVRFDGRFVFAVISTGIYCRPGCPARRPRRDRVKFFSLPEVAEQAGFRPCLRCLPRQTQVIDPRLEMVQQVCRFIEADNEVPHTLASLSRHIQVSPFHLQKVFKAKVGISPRQYAEACRIRKFKAGVRQHSSIAAAMYDAGFGSSSGLYERAPAELGMTPATYGRGGRGVIISFTIVPCPLGHLLIAGTERGICAVKLHESEAELETVLRAEFPAAEIYRNDQAFRDPVALLLRFLSGRQLNLDLPLDITATAFQWLVWDHLRRIPYGQTRTYTQIAKAIGKPSAVRAVAKACATNPVALVIPCHRVIREDRKLAGYRWGLARKRQLLYLERSKKCQHGHD